MRLQRQIGSSLIEVLISIFVVAIGIFCTAALELTALRGVQQSGFQNTAIQLASEIADQIRAEQYGQFQLAHQQNPYLSVNYQADSEPSSYSGTCFNPSSNCQTEDIANFNMSQWEQRIKTTLPKGRLVVCQDSEPWNSAANEYKWECSGAQSGKGQVVVKIGWNEKKPDQESKNQSTNSPPLIAIAVGI